MPNLKTIIPDGEVLISLEVEELAAAIFQTLLVDPIPGDMSILNIRNYLSSAQVSEYPRTLKFQIDRVIVEAWAWLEREGLIAPDPDQSDSWMFITRRGRKLKDPINFRQFVNSASLKRELLHPAIPDHVWSAYLRGDYDSAVFGAFKAVEIVVRQASEFPSEIIGTDLMRRAFAPNIGPLSPRSLPKGEAEALAHLFAGAIGWFKNPQSHRDVKLQNSQYAVQALLFASHLIYVAHDMLGRKLFLDE